MKIKNQSKVSKKIIIVIIVGLLLVGAVSAWWFFSSRNTSSELRGINSIDYGPATDEQKDAGEQIDGSNSKNPNEVGSDRPTPPESNSEGKDVVALSVTSANQNGSIIQIRTLIGAIVNSGSCTLTMTKGSTVVTKQSGVQALASSATCQGFDVQVTDLSPGEWSVHILFENDTLTANINEKIQVE